MPTILPPVVPAAAPAGGNGDVRAAIARAASASGVDFSYLMAQARLESRLDPTARAATSSARGLYQFTDATWAQTLARHGDALDAALGGATNFGGSGGGAVGAALADPTARARLMALRNDPDVSAMMAAALAGDNQAALTNTLGRTPDPSELYLAHFLGQDGATKFLSALSTDPTQSAAAVLPRAAAANAGIFYEAGGAARSVGAVMELVRGKMAGAMADTPAGAGAAEAQLALGGSVYAAAAPAQTAGGPLAQEFAATQAAAAQGGGSMADMLGATFGVSGDGGGAAPAFVRQAYGRLAAMGL